MADNFIRLLSRRIELAVYVGIVIVCPISWASAATGPHQRKLARAFQKSLSQPKTRDLTQASTRSVALEHAALEARAESVIDEGLALAAEWNEVSLRKAIDKLSAALADYQSLKNVTQQIRVLDDIAEILVNLSDYRAAVKTYQQELTLSSNKADEIRALNGLSSVHIYLGERDRAYAYYRQAERLSRAALDRQGEAESLLNSGEILYFRSEGEKAVQAFQQALTIMPAGNWLRRARALINIGYALFDLRDINQALEYYEQALAQSRSERNKRGEALALTAIGGVYSYLGNKQTAVKYQLDAVALFRTIGDRNGRAVALNGLGYAYRNLADFQKSLDCYREALDLFHILGNREYEYFTLTRVGKAYEGLGQRDKALEYYQQAAKRAASYPQTRVNALNSMGSIFESDGKLREAFEYYRRSLSIYRAIKDKMGEAGVLNSIGKIAATSGKLGEAQHSYETALGISKSVHDRRAEFSILLNLAKAQSVAGDFDTARRTIESSLLIVESLRSEVASPSLRASYFASVRQEYETYVDILMRLQGQTPSGHFAEQALAMSEMAHARSLLELLGEAQVDVRAGVDPSLVETERSLAEQLNQAADQHQQMVIANNAEAATDLNKKIDALTAEYDQVTAQIRSTSPRYAELTHPEPLSVSEIQARVLDDNSLLLEYMLGDEHSYVWLVTRTEVFSFELPGRAVIAEAGRKFHALLIAHQPVMGETYEQQQARIKDADAHLAEAAANFSRLVLGPLRDKLGSKRLVIVPDGVLQYIPFQALTIDAAKGEAAQDGPASTAIPLIADHEIVLEPSASILASVLSETAQRQPVRGSVAVFANPVFARDDPRVQTAQSAQSNPADQVAKREPQVRDAGAERSIPPLPASRDEAEAIMNAAPWRTGFSALDFDASREAVMQPAVAGYRIVHLATHGFVDYDHPELSGLVFSLVDREGRPRDGFLRMHDIYNLKLPVDLVVLSACNTALGKEVKGEGLIGLTRGFMYAGAGGVVASLWKVDDEATAELMKRFYTAMFQQGLTPAAALRQAQIEMWQSKRWHEPYYWAAFVIQGQYNQNVAVPRRFSWSMLLAVVAILSLATFSTLLILRKRRQRISSGTMGR